MVARLERIFHRSGSRLRSVRGAGIIAFTAIIACATAEEPIDSPLSRQAASTTTETQPFQYDLKYPKGVTILFNGCRGSRIEPCGCRALNLGGIDKEAAMIQTIRGGNPNTLFVDAGGFFREFTDPGMRLATWHLVDALAHLGIHALNIGYPDLNQGLATLKDFQQRWKLPIISANIVDAATGQPVFESYKSIELSLPGGITHRIAIVGVTAPNKDTSHGAALPSPANETSATASAVTPRGRWMIAESNGSIPWLPYDVHSQPHGQGGAALTSGPGGASPAIDFAIGAAVSPPASFAPYRVDDPVQAARDLGERLRPTNDTLVLLAYVAHATAVKMAAELSEYDFIIAGDYIEREEVTHLPGKAPLVISGDHDGKYLGILELSTTATKSPAYEIHTELLPILQSIEPLPEFTNHLAQYATDTAALPIEQPSAGTFEKIYAGVSSCRACHIDAYTQWKGHHHSRAMKALVDKNMHFNPDCLKCHTVAYRKPGGFTDLRVTANLANVQCEVCHGPGEAHVKEMRAIEALQREGKPAPTPKEVMKMDWDKNFCMQCHDPQNDPHFDFAQDIQRVRHKNPAAPRTRPTTVSLEMM